MPKPDCKIHDDQPAGCPPSDAMQFSGTIYRAIKGSAAVETDFISFAEQGRDTDLCTAWGLSVWTTETGVVTARKVVPGFRRKCIVRVTVTDADGLMLATPSSQQLEHRTFWRAKGVQLHKNATVHIARKNDNVAG